MKIESFNKQNTGLLQEEISNFFKGIEEKYGIRLVKNTGSLSEKEVRFTITVKAEGVSDTESLMAQRYGWPAVGSRFLSQGSTYEVTGWEFRRPKYPIRAKNINTGKEVLFTEHVKGAIEHYAKTQAVK